MELTDTEDDLLLLFANKGSSTGTIMVLIDAGYNIEVRDEKGRTPLCVAAAHGHINIVELLLDEGADIEAADLNRCTALILAVEEGHTDVVKALVEEGACLEKADINGRTALSLAAYHGRIDMISTLVDAGADFETEDYYGQTPVYLSTMRGHIDVLETLFERGADVYKRDKNGNLALVAAVRGASDIIVRTVLIVGMQIGHEELVHSVLFEMNADVSGIDRYGQTPLCAASEHGFTDIVKMLIGRGADLDKPDIQGMTPLCMACSCGHCDIAKILIDAGADVNLTGWWNEELTPLSYAAERGFEDVVLCLLEAGADIDIVSDNGETALDLAVRNRNYSSARAIIIRLVLNNYKRPVPGCIVNNFRLLHFWNSTRSAVKNMHHLKIGDTFIPWYKLVMENNENKLACYIADANLEHIPFKDFEILCTENHDAYYGVIRKQFHKGKRRASLLASCHIVLKHCSLHRIPIEVRQKFIEYLSNDELKNIVKAGVKVMDERKYQLQCNQIQDDEFSFENHHKMFF